MSSLSWMTAVDRLALLLPLLSAGCLGTSDPHHPGEPLGTFHVVAVRTMTTCGEGALGSMPMWAFDVKLSRGETTLFWDNGAEIVPGELSADGVTFAFETGVVVDMREGQGGSLPPCSVRRVDRAKGVLSEAGGAMLGFKGSLSYAFAPEAGSSCSDLVSGEAPVLAALPCSMAYALDAEVEGEGEDKE
jgi:hypothetical protein